MRFNQNIRLARSIFFKFTLAFIVAGLIPLLFFSYFSLGTFSKNIEEFTINNMEHMMELVAANLDKAAADYNNITKLLYSFDFAGFRYLEDFINYIKNEPVQIRDRFSSTQFMNNFVNYLINIDAHIQNVIFIDKNMKVYYATKVAKQFNMNYDFKANRLDRIHANGKKLTIFPPRREAYFVRSNDLMLTFARNYYDLNYFEHPKILGSIMVDVDLDIFTEAFSGLALGENGAIYVVDKEGYCIYSNNQGIISTKLDWYLRQQPAFAAVGTSGVLKEKETYFIFQDVPAGGWTLIGKVAKGDILKKVETIRNYIGLIIISCILALILVSLAFSKGFTIPMRKLLDQMRQVEGGNFEVRMQVTSQDEIGQLAEGFNQMTRELQSYINKSYLSQIKQKDAELNALKTQIQPHFLYNTLEVIRMTAVDAGDDKVGEMIHSLAVQLKYVIGNNRDMVSLGQELEMVQNYFHLIEMRYDGQIVLELNIPTALLHLSILKLTLEPIVENAVIHGIKPKAARGMVKVSAGRDNGNLELTVADDGIGIDPERLAEIKQLLAGKKMGKHTPEGWVNIGVKNVHDRLRFKFGDNYGIQIASRPGEGTVVRLVMPIIREGTDNDVYCADR